MFYVIELRSSVLEYFFLNDVRSIGNIVKLLNTTFKLLGDYGYLPSEKAAGKICAETLVGVLIMTQYCSCSEHADDFRSYGNTMT